MSRYCLAILFNFLSITSLAQITSDSLINSNLRFGMKLSLDVSNDYSYTPEHAFIFSEGFQVLWKITPRSGLETGLYYVQRMLAGDGLMYGEIKFGFLQLPLCYRYDSRIFYLVMGGYGDFLLRRDYETDGHEKLDNTNYRKTHLGFNAALGLEKQIDSRVNAFIEIRFQQNLTSTEKYDKGDFIDPGFRNVGAAIGLNYAFGVK